MTTPASTAPHDRAPAPRYNGSPGQDLLVIRRNPTTGANRLVSGRPAPQGARADVVLPDLHKQFATGCSRAGDQRRPCGIYYVDLVVSGG